jgi:hypothetical protein
MIFSDLVKIYHVLFNLLTNSFKYTNQGFISIKVYIKAEGLKSEYIEEDEKL